MRQSGGVSLGRAAVLAAVFAGLSGAVCALALQQQGVAAHVLEEIGRASCRERV